jgi:hypothetical protein
MNGTPPPNGTFDDGGSRPLQTRLNAAGHLEGLVDDSWVVLRRNAVREDEALLAAVQLTAIALRAAQDESTFESARVALSIEKNPQWARGDVQSRASQMLNDGARDDAKIASLVGFARTTVASVQF